MVKRSLLVCISALILVVSCSKSTVNVSEFKPLPQDSETIQIPDMCKFLYESKSWSIAVVEFTNNTGYGDMHMRNSSTQGNINAQTESVVVGAAVSNRSRTAAVGAAVGASDTRIQYSSNSNEFMGQFAPALGAFAQNAIEEAISQMGGVTIYDRANMNKIMAEQKFQMAIADPDTAVEFGRLSGVKYILTGSVDNIAAKYTAPTNVRDTGDNVISMMLSLGSTIYDAAASGWNVTMEYTIKMLDTETGKVLYSKKMSKTANASQNQNFQPDLIINAAKKLLSSSVIENKHEFVSLFAISGYINEMRGGKRIAQVNVGSEHGIKPGDVFDVYDVATSQDFLTKTTKCSTVKTNVTFEASAVSTQTTWGYITGKDSELANVKIGSFVQRSKLGK